MHNYIVLGVIFLFLWKCSLALIFLSADCKLIISSKLLTQVTNFVLSSKQTKYSSQIASWWHMHLAFPATIYPLVRGMDGSGNISSWGLDEDIIELPQKSHKRQLLGWCWPAPEDCVAWLRVRRRTCGRGTQEQRVSLQPTQSVWAHQQALGSTTGTSPLKQQEKNMWSGKLLQSTGGKSKC